MEQTSDRIQSAIERIVNATRDDVGTTGTTKVHQYECEDDRVVTAELTDYEAFCVDRELYGDDVATENYEVLKRW